MEVKALMSKVWESLNDLKQMDVSDGKLSEYAVRWLLYSIHQDLLDALSIMIARAGLRKPPTYSGIVDLLHERGIIDAALRDILREVVRNRNRLAHAYRVPTRDELKALRKWVLENIPQAVGIILSIVDKLNVDPGDYVAAFSKLREVFKRHGVVLAMLFGSRARGIIAMITTTI